MSEITPETLAALEILDPTPDLLIVGTGRTIAALNEETLNYLKELGVAVDASDTVNATSTFNVLVEEGRRRSSGALTSRARREVARAYRLDDIVLGAHYSLQAGCYKQIKWTRVDGWTREDSACVNLHE